MTYEEARAKVEARIELLDSYNAFRAGRGLPKMDREMSFNIASVRTLLAGPPEPTEEEVARVIHPQVWEARDRAMSGGPFVPWNEKLDRSLTSASLTKARTIQQLYRSRHG